MRLLGVDVGRRRSGLALSDASGLLARPWRTVPAAPTPVESAARLAALFADPGPDADMLAEVGAIVVGLPRRLNGEEHDETRHARERARALEARLARSVHLQDERLTSREAESRLALQERDWRRRKAKIDAAAAAIILQDYIDSRPAPATDGVASSSS